MQPFSSSTSSILGMAVISLDLASVACCASTSPLAVRQAPCVTAPIPSCGSGNDADSCRRWPPHLLQTPAVPRPPTPGSGPQRARARVPRTPDRRCRAREYRQVATETAGTAPLWPCRALRSQVQPPVPQITAVRAASAASASTTARHEGHATRPQVTRSLSRPDTFPAFDREKSCASG
jgi:hypothetical protein